MLGNAPRFLEQVEKNEILTFLPISIQFSVRTTYYLKISGRRKMFDTYKKGKADVRTEIMSLFLT